MSGVVSVAGTRLVLVLARAGSKPESDPLSSPAWSCSYSASEPWSMIDPESDEGGEGVGARREEEGGWRVAMGRRAEVLRVVGRREERRARQGALERRSTRDCCA